MSRQLTPRSTLDTLRKEAKRWLKALRAGDADARTRLDRILPGAPATPVLRDIQHALAREHGLAGWADLKREIERIRLASASTREDALRALLRAAERGAAADVAALLDRFPDIIDERGDPNGTSGLRTALHFGIAHEAVVRVLLERGANPNIRDEGDDAMPLHFAAERGDLAIVRLLIERGADPVGEGTGHELNVLGWAVCWDNVHNADTAEYLLGHGARHTIHTAVALGDVTAIRAIAAPSPADIEQPMDRTNRRRRPLHLAVVKQQRAALATLLELGANPDALDGAGLTPLDQAALNGDASMVDLLIAGGASLALPAAVVLGREADIDRMLRDSPDALKPGNQYSTLIVRASERASGDIIERLIRAGASVNVRDDETTAVDQTHGYTPLHAAAFNGNIAAIRVLLKHGADPNIRERKYCGAPAGWAAYAGHPDARDLILDAGIDLFQAIAFDRTTRIADIVRQSPWMLNREFRDFAPWEPAGSDSHPEPWHTPLVWAAVQGKADAVRALLELGAAPVTAPDGRTLQQVARDSRHENIAALLKQYERFDEMSAGRTLLFVRNACPDHTIRGPWHHVMAQNAAMRLLEQQPDIARDSLYGAIICGDIAEVERRIAASPDVVNRKIGPKHWEPLLYLCFTRLPLHHVTGNAVAVARLLLDRGADPNVFFMAGDSRYSPLVGAIGEGEEDRPAHQQRAALVRLLLERGAEPYDTQVIYNIHFHGTVRWYLELIYEHSLRLGRARDWQDPDWSMLDMRGYGSGARYFLNIALGNNDLTLARWLLEHGAGPNAQPARDPRLPKTSLYEQAGRHGLAEMAELLLQFGAVPVEVERDVERAFVDACLRLDREAVQRLLAERPHLIASPAAMLAAARRNRADVVTLLLDLGVSADVEDDTRQRALHIAAYHDAVDVAKLLIERGAEIDPVEQNFDNTPLDGAVYSHHPRMIELLAQYSGEVWNLTFTGSIDRLRELFAAAPERARTITDNNETLLMWLPDDDALAVEIVQLLLEHGADASVVSREGRTAADYASRRGLARAASILRGAAAGGRPV